MRETRTYGSVRGARDETRVPTATSSQPRTAYAAVHESGPGRFCCKSLFALAIKNSFGRRRDFRVKMWGTSSPEDKLAGDLGNVIEATSIRGRRSDFFYSRKISAGPFGTFATISAHHGRKSTQRNIRSWPKLT